MVLIRHPSSRHRWRSPVAYGQRLRRKLAPLRQLALVMRNELRRQPLAQSNYAEIYRDRSDPFGYDVKPFESEKFNAAIELLDGLRNHARFARAWEIGCAEGVFTARLAPLCERFTAVDYVPLALERARIRCREFGNISFSEWDLKSDPAPGAFELIVIMDVLGCMGRNDIVRARDKVVSALAPGGYLLFGDCFGEPQRRLVQANIWGRLQLRGPRNIHRFVAAHPALSEIACRETSAHLLALFRNRR